MYVCVKYIIPHHALSKLTADVLYHHLHWTIVQNSLSSASGKVLNSSDTKFLKADWVVFMTFISLKAVHIEGFSVKEIVFMQCKFAKNVTYVHV